MTPCQECWFTNKCIGIFDLQTNIIDQQDTFQLPIINPGPVLSSCFPEAFYVGLYSERPIF